MDYIREFDIRLDREMYYAGETVMGHVLLDTVENFKLRGRSAKMDSRTHAAVGQAPVLAATRDLLLDRAFTNVPPSDRSSSARMILDRAYDLNPSRTKRLCVGLDATRKLSVQVYIENTKFRSGVLVPSDVFEKLVYDSAFNDRVAAYISSESPSIHVAKKEGMCEAKCINITEVGPAIRLFIDDKNYVILGASTWRLLQEMRPMIMSKVCELGRWCASDDFVRYFHYCLKNMASAAISSGYGHFANEHEAQFFVKSNLKSADSMSTAVQPWHDMVLELAFRHTDIFGRIVYSVVNDNVLDGVVVPE
ncbi:uncharacterized protein LOC113210414 isoform X2 [Frankliniella occidentalis]|uniref:Uncharacterized protein LOC113210414 isoform X2 n=1 Tax=Frankliniella occidentalis TaxID=133901 RepID=A0A9C6WWS3_FRAOC|nr:uncharacterized protein LOC113210414 isoform X2 [Frankliniella occidentalis]